MTANIDHCTHKTITDAQIARRTEHFNRMLAEELPEDPPYVVEDALKRMRTLPSISRSHIWLARAEDRVVAQAYLGWVVLESNRRLASVDITVEPDWRRRKLGTHLLALAVTRARAVRRTLLIASTSDRVPAGRIFLERMGFQAGLETHLNQLVLGDLDCALMRRWISEAASRARGYNLEIWDGPVPEAQLEAFALLTNVMNGAPRGTLKIEDTHVTPKMIREGERCLFSNGNRRLIASVRHEPTGELAGYTDLMWNPKRATLVWQGSTGVIEAHRGNGLGRWLKAANVLAMLRENGAARFLRTGNADCNAPMLRINHDMGYRPLIAEIAWQGQASSNVCWRKEPP